MARLRLVGQQILIAANDVVGDIQAHIAEVARAAHAEVMATEPKPASFRRTVDGVEGASEDAVKADGVIVYDYPRMTEVVTFALKVLFDLSPVSSGKYRQSHTVFLSGVASGNLADWRPGAEISISNPVPYARKIELGAMKMRVPGSEKVYQQALRKVVGRFGNVASIQFTYRAIVDGNQVDQMAMPSFGQPWYRGGAPARAGADGTAAAATRARLKNGRFAKSGLNQIHNRSELRFPTLIIKER